MATSVTKSTGSSGTMRIYDDGTTVSFQLKAASGTYNHDLPWGYTINGVTNNSRSADFVGDGGYQTLDGYTVTTDQTVTFRIFDSETSGIGGPTTLTMAIARSTAPPAPTAPTFTAITDTSFTADTNSNGNGGDAIDLIQIGIGLPTNGSPTIIYTANGSGAYNVTGRVPGTQYRVWGRMHNSKGYSPWSVSSYVTTHDVPDPPSTPVISEITQTSVRVKFTDAPNNGGAVVSLRQIGYGLDPDAESSTISAFTGDQVITGLDAGKTYYFWARTANTYGYSDWSPKATAKLLAGAKVLVGAVWKDAVPYVRDGGVWKVAWPYVRQGGFWKAGL